SSSRRTNCWVEKICWVSGPCNYTVKTPGGSKRRPGGVVVQQLFQAQGQGLALLDHLTELQQVYFQLLVDITRLLEARGALATRYTATRPPGAAGGVAGRRSGIFIAVGAEDRGHTTPWDGVFRPLNSLPPGAQPQEMGQAGQHPRVLSILPSGCLPALAAGP